jgi:hypothetical protein
MLLVADQSRTRGAMHQWCATPSIVKIGILQWLYLHIVKQAFMNNKRTVNMQEQTSLAKA